MPRATGAPPGDHGRSEKLAEILAGAAPGLRLGLRPDAMTSPTPDTPAHDAVLDVGEKLCGELALLLRSELKGMEAGQVLLVVARDPAAPQDLPAWCEVTGHRMLKVEHPNYWIRRRDP